MYDIETTNFAADFGEMTHFGHRDIMSDDPVVVKSCYDTKSWKKDILDDSDLVKYAVDILDDADIIIGHYSRKFDLPFIQTRALGHDLDVVDPKKKHVDTWAMARFKGKFQGNSMANICDYFDFGEKYFVPKKVWRRANTGHIPSLKIITERCASDVEVTELMFRKLNQIAPTQFNVNVITGDPSLACPCCGSINIKKKGYTEPGLTGKFQRYICLEENCKKQFQDRENLATKKHGFVPATK